MEEYNNVENQGGQGSAPEEMQRAPEPAQDAPKHGGAMGPMIGIVVVIVVLLIGGLYLWGAQLNKEALEFSADEERAPLDLESATNESTDPADIEADLDNFNVDTFDADIDADLNALEAELGGIE